ncbi:uncharacterized protein LOC135844838 isoform X2 [Planococcus citri]
MAQLDAAALARLLASLETLATASTERRPQTENQSPALPFQPYKEADESFSSFLERLENHISYRAIPETDKAKVFINSLSPKHYSLLKTLVQPSLPKEKTYDDLTKVLKAHLEPQPNHVAEQYKFTKFTQKENESFSDFLGRLQQAAGKCDFKCPHCDKSTIETHLRTQFICGINDSEIREKLLQDATLTTDGALKQANVFESSRGVRNLSNNHQSAKIGKIMKNKSSNSRSDSQTEEHKPKSKCYRCGYKNHSGADCKYKSATCDKCKKIGHLANMCKTKSTNSTEDRKKSVKSVDKRDNDAIRDERDMYQVNTSSNAKNKLLINVNVNNATIPMEVDTGAEISAMCLEEFRRKFGNMKLEPADCSLRSYFKEESSPLG